jgi:urea transporter
MNEQKSLPLWRQILRGFSQCAFQANEITGVVFIAAVTVYAWQANKWNMPAFYILGVVLGTLTAKLLRGIPPLLDLGLYGFNSGLIGLAFGCFFKHEPMIWAWVAGFAIVAAVLTVVMSKWVPIPFLAAPFILTFWLAWLCFELLGLHKADLGAFPAVQVEWGKSILYALGSALFSSNPWTGVLFLVGIAVSNWRHAIVAVIGALVANALAAEAHRTEILAGSDGSGGAINFGFVGFNGVLAALAAYALIAEDLRAVVLASLTATWFASYIFHLAPIVPVLASGFVLSIWAIMLLGWLNPRFAGKPPTSSPAPS